MKDSWKINWVPGCVTYFLLLPFNLMHVFWLLHHFSELGKINSLFHFSVVLRFDSTLSVFLSLCHRLDQRSQTPCTEARPAVNLHSVPVKGARMVYSQGTCLHDSFWNIDIKATSCGLSIYCQWLTLETLFVVAPNRSFPVFSHPVHSLAQEQHLLNW